MLPVRPSGRGDCINSHCIMCISSSYQHTLKLNVGSTDHSATAPARVAVCVETCVYLSYLISLSE